MNNYYLTKKEDCRTWVEISQKAYKDNLDQFKKLIGSKVKLMAVVKSNAYGHGILKIGKIAQDQKVNWLGVDSIDEAILLKEAGIKLPILILGYTLKSRLKEAVDNGFRLTVYNPETIKELGKINQKSYVHIKLETGTSRQGVLEKDILDFVKLIKKYPQIQIEGLSTHYANIEDTTDHSYAKKQLKIFKRVVLDLEKNGFKIPIKHTACSAATILFPETYFDMVRVGISSYGLWSSKETKVSANSLARKINLQPVLTWKTRIAQIKSLPAGTFVSYGLTEKLMRDSKIAILPVGYWDGFDRHLSSIGNVLIGGYRCKVLGRVCMNMTIVDVTDLSDVQVEDEVVLIGKQEKEEITADEIAQKLGTINYEVVTRINPLLPRIIV